MRKSIVYSVAVLAISYSIAGGLIFTGILNDEDQTTRFIVSALYMFLPLVTALIFDRIIYKNNLIDSWGLRLRFNRWLFSPLAIIPMFVLLAIAISLLFPGTRLELSPV